jgi:SGNH domain (fused to AT3 domains)
VALVVSVVVAEASYRYVETPIRHGALGRWFVAARTHDWRVVSAAGVVTLVALLVPLLLFFTSVDHYDPAAGGSDVAFELPVAPTDSLAEVTGSTAGTAPGDTLPTAAPIVPAISAPNATPAVAPAGTQPVLPRHVVVVGDSMAHALAINLPAGIESTFSIADGSVEGCSVYDSGSVKSNRKGFSRSFGNCSGWATKWADAAASSHSNLALVVIGAWDVFDVDVDGQPVAFASAAGDARFLDGLQVGIDALVAAGSHVALLEVACMRPQDVKGAGVPALPERGDDARVGHLNDLLRQAAAAQPASVTFVSGPTQWCADEAISSDLGYRWDGVHVYKPGANLIYETIAQSLLDIPLP